LKAGAGKPTTIEDALAADVAAREDLPEAGDLNDELARLLPSDVASSLLFDRIEVRSKVLYSTILYAHTSLPM
jgi:hypothetical protein